MSLRLWLQRGARAGALLVAVCGLLALGICLNGHGQLLALGLPGAPPMTPGSALGFLLAGLAVAAMSRPPIGWLHVQHAALPLLVVSVISLACVFALPQGRLAAVLSPPLLSLSFALVAGAALCFDPRAGRGMVGAVVAAVVGTAASSAVVVAYAAWWLQSGERLLLVTQAPQAAVLQMALALAIGGLSFAATAEGSCRRHASPLAVAGVTTAGLVAAWALILGNDSTGIARDVEQRTDSVAQTLLEHMHRSLDPADLILRQVADRIRRQGLDRFGQSRQEWEELAVAAASLQQISALVILDAQGRVMSYSARFPPALPGSFAFRDYFLAHRRGDITFLGPLIDTAWGQQAFTYSRRVSDRDGNFAGVVVATLELDYFRSFYRSLNLGPGGAVSLLRSDGRALLREPMPADLGSVNLRRHALFTRPLGAGDGGSFVGVSPFDQEQRFVGYRVSKVHPLVVTASVSAVPLARGFERKLFASALLLTLAIAVLAKATAQQLRALRRDTEQQAQLEASRSFTRAILDSVAATVAIVDREGRIVDANKAWARFAQAHGAEPGAANGLDVLRRAGAADHDGLTGVLWGIQAVMRKDLPWSKHNYECTGVAGTHWYKVRVTPLEGVDGCVVISQEDVSDLKRAELTLRQAQAELKHQASVDSLTSLLTRRHFNQLAEQEIRHGRHALTALMVDIDHFKRVNDGFGHPAGDLVLLRVAEALKGVLRGSDLVGRFGGEEFAALLVGADEREGLRAAARLRKALRRLVVPHKGQEIRVTASVGISAWRPGEENLEPALGRADEALYAAKAAGRDRARVHEPGLAGAGGEPARAEGLAEDAATAGDAGAPVSLG